MRREFRCVQLGWYLTCDRLCCRNFLGRNELLNCVVKSRFGSQSRDNISKLQVPCDSKEQLSNRHRRKDEDCRLRGLRVHRWCSKHSRPGAGFLCNLEHSRFEDFSFRDEPLYAGSLLPERSLRTELRTKFLHRNRQRKRTALNHGCALRLLHGFESLSQHPA